MAEAILAKVRVNLIEGRYFDLSEEKQHTVAEMLERYMAEYSVMKASTSQQRDRQVLSHILKAFGHKTLAEVTPKELTAFKIARRNAGMAPATINKELGLLKTAFTVASREWEWCRDNPVRRVMMERVNNTRLRYFNDDEFARMLQHCPGWLRPIVLIARYTGLRRQNIVMLRWDQIDLFRKVILLDRTKNGDRLGVPVCETLMDTLKTLSKVRHLRSRYVFAQPDGSPYKGMTVGITFSRACKRAGIADFRFHDLRHTFASSLVQPWADLYRVPAALRPSGRADDPALCPPKSGESTGGGRPARPELSRIQHN